MARALLQRLVDASSFGDLQEKLDGWLDDFSLNSSDENAERCVELLEINARQQAQLFRLLDYVAAEGGTYGSVAALKARLRVPWLGAPPYYYPGGALSPYFGAPEAWAAWADVAAKERELRDLQAMYERSLASVETDLGSTQAEADQLQIELSEKTEELDALRRKATSERILTDSEVQELRSKLRSMETEMVALRARSDLVDMYERQVRRLREDVALMSGQKSSSAADSEPERLGSAGALRSSRPTSPTRGALSSRAASPGPAGGGSALSGGDPGTAAQKYRQQKLIGRYNELFWSDRFAALDVLRDYSSDSENNNKIIFAAVQESFSVARLAVINFKMTIRSTLAATHKGPDTLEQAVQDFLSRNPDAHDLKQMQADVIRGLNRHPGLFLPPGVSYSIIQLFIRELCRLAWAMSALPRPLELAPAGNFELFDDSKYRRSYDSNPAAPLVAYHIWPCLLQGTRVAVKGEAFTERSSALTPRRGRSPLRSYSPSRGSLAGGPLGSSSPRRGSPSPRRAAGRSRSISPLRNGGRSSSPGRLIR